MLTLTSQKFTKMKPKVLCLVLSAISFVTSEPQLDLPRGQSTSTPRNDREGPEVQVMPNSYTSEKHDVQAKSDSNYRFDSDRSQRFGRRIESSSEISKIK